MTTDSMITLGLSISHSLHHLYTPGVSLIPMPCTPYVALSSFFTSAWDDGCMRSGLLCVTVWIENEMCETHAECECWALHGYYRFINKSMLKPVMCISSSLVEVTYSDLANMMHLPHFVGEVQFCAEFLQREHMDMGKVQEEVTADVIQFISW